MSDVEAKPRDRTPRESAVELDSAGVYFMDVADFEWRPARESEGASDEEGAQEKGQDHRRSRTPPA